MIQLPQAPFDIINRYSELDKAISGIGSYPAIALDTESNSRHRYPEQLCLIQIAVDTKVYLIDTIVLKELAPLGKVLADASLQKVLHGADYDVRCLDRHYGFRVRKLYDTSVAARFAGITEFGLAALLKNLLGITIAKSERVQQADWGIRPLSTEALQYAASDVRHLFALRDVLNERLRSLGRADWVAEECARLEEVRYNAPDPATAFLNVKGAQMLDGPGLSVLRSLHQFREEAALRRGRPPHFIMADNALVALAASPGGNLETVLGPVVAQRYGQGVREALRRGRSALPFRLPVKASFRMTQEQSSRYVRLKTWRAGLGAELSLDPSLLWPMASLERIARDPHSLEGEFASSMIRNWQRREIAPFLRVALAR